MDHRVANLDDLPDGGMRAFEIEGHCILVSRTGGRVSAVSGHCTHQGGPLADGVRLGGRVICPWHHAIFDLASGGHLEPPGEGRLMAFPIRVENGAIILTLGASVSDERDEVSNTTARQNGKTFVIAGAGAAGRSAAEELRRQGFDGRILLFSMEKEAPYDRTALSKSFLAGQTSLDDLQLLSPEKLAGKGIELVPGRKICKILAPEKKIIFDGGGSLSYDACLAATGCAAQIPDIKNTHLSGVISLRSKADGILLKEAAAYAEKIIIIGSGFIGMETAAVFAGQNKAVTVVTPDAKPFAKIFGSEIAAALIAAHGKAGTKIRLDTPVAEIVGEHDKAAGVILKSGEILPADLIVLGTGAKPQISMIEGAVLSEDGGISTDATLKAADGLWAAGDIASFPSPFSDGAPVRIEHWRLAEQLGRHAARAMLGDRAPFTGIPFFWTHQHWMLSLIGVTNNFENIHIEGDLQAGNFMAYFSRGNRIIAGAGAGDRGKTAALHALFLSGGNVSVNALSEAGWDPQKLLKKKALQPA